MKLIIKISLVVALFYCNFCVAQPFIDTTKTWSLVVVNSGGGPAHGSKVTFSYKFSGDTVINTLKYFKLYESSDINRTDWNIHSLWREENDSICRYNPYTGITRLIYDFNLAESDSFKIDESLKLLVDSVRTQKWGGKIRKHWYLTDSKKNSSKTTVWIEGVGNMNNFTRSTDINITGGYSSLLCFTEKGAKVFQNPQYNSCYISESLFTKEMLWSTMMGPGGDCGNYYCWSYYTKVAGDTLIDEKQYKRVLNSNDSLMNHWSVVGYIREVGQKVFYRRMNTEIDCLLYDFSCLVGDTLNLNCWCPDEESKFKVDSIKYLPVMGENRKHIYLSYLSNSSTELWIEGIGSIGGILNGGGSNNCITGGSENLLCCSKNGVELYHDHEYNNCYLGSKTVNSVQIFNVKNRFLKIFPNPSSSEINIKLNKSPANTLTGKIIAIDGTTIKLFKIDNNTNYTLDVRLLKPGMYFIHVRSGAEIYIEKIIIN